MVVIFNFLGSFFFSPELFRTDSQVFFFLIIVIIIIIKYIVQYLHGPYYVWIRGCMIFACKFNILTGDCKNKLGLSWKAPKCPQAQKVLQLIFDLALGGASTIRDH